MVISLSVAVVLEVVLVEGGLDRVAGSWEGIPLKLGNAVPSSRGSLLAVAATISDGGENDLEGVISPDFLPSSSVMGE